MLKIMHEFILTGITASRRRAEDYLKEFGYTRGANLSMVNDMYALLCIGDESKKDELLKKLEEDPDFVFGVFKSIKTSIFSPPRYSHNNPFL